ncbi:MAG: YbeF family protein [Clostridia bacterium]|nr:YbeF family protein [Clostridia bacterium]
MSNLLIFFALPLATIIIAVVLERIWKNYILVTLFTFAVYLIVAFAIGDANLLVLVIIYTVLAFIAAFLSMLFRKINKKLKHLEEIGGVNDENERRHCHHHNENGNISDTNNNENNCNCNRNNTQNLAINAEVSPNRCNNGRTGTFRGQYRRRF